MPSPVVGHAGQHRVEGAARDRRLQVVDDRVEADLLAAQVAVQQAVVLGLGDHRLDQRSRGGRRSPPARPSSAGRATRAPVRMSKTVCDSNPINAVGCRRLRFGRQVQRVHAVPEHQLAILHRRREIAARLVDVGDDHRARHADVGALLPEHPGGAVDRRRRRGALRRGDDEQGGVRGPQAGPQFADEIGVPGGVHQIDPDRGPGMPAAGAGVVGCPSGFRQVAWHGAPATPIGRPVVRRPRNRRRWCRSRSSRAADGSGRGQDRLDQHGLSGPAGADQHHVANLFGGSVSGRLTGPLGHTVRPARVEARWRRPTGRSLPRRTSGCLIVVTSGRPQRSPRPGAAAVSAGKWHVLVAGSLLTPGSSRNRAAGSLPGRGRIAPPESTAPPGRALCWSGRSATW